METPADSHHKFHASAALKAALARVRAAADARAAAAADGDPGDALPAPADGDGDDARAAEEEPLDATAGALSDELTSRVLRILWSNWEDPLSQTVKEVQAAFEEMVDAKTGASASPEEARRFLSDAAARLLAKDASSKGRYVPLATLVPRLGARNLLAIRPEVLSETFAAMRDDSVCTAAATLVSALSARLLREMQEEHARGGGGATSASSRGLGGAKEVCVDAGGGPAVAAWRSWWIPPLLAALLSPGREKVGVANYALPALVRQDGASIVALLEGLVRGDDGENEANDGENEADDGAKNAAKRRKTEDALESVVGFDLSDSSSAAAALGARRSAALVSVLRAARAAALLDPDCIARVSVAVSAAAGSGSASGSSAPYEVPRSLLERAVVCKDARAREWTRWSWRVSTGAARAFRAISNSRYFEGRSPCVFAATPRRSETDSRPCSVSFCRVLKTGASARRRWRAPKREDERRRENDPGPIPTTVGVGTARRFEALARRRPRRRRRRSRGVNGARRGPGGSCARFWRRRTPDRRTRENTPRSISSTRWLRRGIPPRCHRTPVRIPTRRRIPVRIPKVSRRARTRSRRRRTRRVSARSAPLRCSAPPWTRGINCD